MQSHFCSSCRQHSAAIVPSFRTNILQANVHDQSENVYEVVGLEQPTITVMMWKWVNRLINLMLMRFRTRTKLLLVLTMSARNVQTSASGTDDLSGDQSGAYYLMSHSAVCLCHLIKLRPPPLNSPQESYFAWEYRLDQSSF